MVLFLIPLTNTLRFVRGAFEDGQLPTIGAAYMTKKVDNNLFEIWDTAGQERYESITPLYYRSSKCAIVVFDVCDATSLTKAKSWVKRLRKELPRTEDRPEMPVVLAGNKCDVDEDMREVSNEEAQAVAEEFNLQYFETSAKSGQGYV